jgi:DNA-binding transcriptional regulator YdaS (Cro superfamily)
MTTDQIVTRIGGPTAVARMCGIAPPSVIGWARIPTDRCAQIERATEGAVTCEEMRPDVTWVRIPDPEWPHPLGRPLLDVSRRREKVAA